MATNNPVKLQPWRYERNVQGYCPVKLVYNKQSKRYKISTGFFVKLSNWDYRYEKIKNPESPYDNDELHTLKERLLSLIRQYRLDHNGENPSVDYVRQQFSLEAPTATRQLFQHYIEDFIDSKKPLVTYHSYKDYRAFWTIYLEFEAYQGHSYTFEDFDKKLLERFHSFLLSVKAHQDNTVYNYFKTLRSVFNYYYHLGYHSNTAHKHYRVPHYQPEIITLSKDELQLIKHHVPDKGRYHRVRDLFLFGCGVGLRYGDLKKITPEHFILDPNGICWLDLRTNKTKHKACPPVTGTARAIAEAYHYQLPVISNQRFNQYIKEMLYGIAHFRQATERQISVQGRNEHTTAKEKYQLIGTHSMRRTFITHCLEQGVPEKTLMAWTGLNNLRTFTKYMNKRQGQVEQVHKIAF